MLYYVMLLITILSSSSSSVSFLYLNFLTYHIVCYVFFGECELVNEESIYRTTLYLPKYLHNAAKDAGINFSKEMTRYLETVLFGDNQQHIHMQYQKLLDHKKNLECELASVNSRLVEIKRVMDESTEQLRSEQELYGKFMRNAQARIRTGKQGGSIDYNKLASFWRHDFFPKNGLKSDTAERILTMVDQDSFDFDCFKKLRRGVSFEA